MLYGLCNGLQFALKQWMIYFLIFLICNLKITYNYRFTEDARLN